MSKAVRTGNAVGFTEAQQEYIDYLERVNYTQNRPLIELNKEYVIREVGRHYGLTEQDMDSTVYSYVECMENVRLVQ